jgi:hypothetical protein
VLRDVLGLGSSRIAELDEAGVFGKRLRPDEGLVAHGPRPGETEEAAALRCPFLNPQKN